MKTTQTILWKVYPKVDVPEGSPVYGYGMVTRIANN